MVGGGINFAAWLPSQPFVINNDVASSRMALVLLLWHGPRFQD
jgi:hypothetical protein